MSTKNPRINVTIDPESVALLTALAKQEDKSLSSLVQELILDSLDRREDRALSTIAQVRDNGKLR